MRKKIAILGATGSIGSSVLRLVDLHPDRFDVVALAAQQSWQLMETLAKRHAPEVVALADVEAATELEQVVDVPVLSGQASIAELAAWHSADIVVLALVGIAGLHPMLSAIKAGKTILLANKEVLVAAGEHVMHAVAQSQASIVPIDSEHSAIAQCMQGNSVASVHRILLTASGGPFKDYSYQALESVQPQAALKHPNWSMGAKISVDSATLMNKGFEYIEACWLFHLPPEKIEVIVHKESIIHALVEYIDGALIAHLSQPDMRIPIAFGLEESRIATGVPMLDLIQQKQLNFEQPDHKRFPLLSLAVDVFKQAGTYPAVLNAANEVAVSAFLSGQINFFGIHAVISQCLDAHTSRTAIALDHVLAADLWAREYAKTVLSVHS